ncbi:FmdB family zinc ribbon protein [Microbacterium halophytorum]|uniref:FmdB family zinc ribbon protein n=1 Tax=Microbacterium halophytorum TaxID=2067568 RepID=UPI000CFB7B4E|nr:FmdB family zinc ribbon protein [Microbacterium halophytorum]
MPTYAYACKSCENAFDAVQSFSEPSLTECPACGGALRKVYGSIGVTFNGGGFYRTDSRASAGTTDSGASSSASSAPATSSSTGATAPAPASA